MKYSLCDITYTYVCLCVCMLIYRVICIWRPCFQITFSISLSPSSLSRFLPLCSFRLLTNPACRSQNVSWVSGVSERGTSHVVLTHHPVPGGRGSRSRCQRARACHALLSLSFLSLGKSRGTSESQLPCLMCWSVGANERWSVCPLVLWGLNVRLDVTALYELQCRGHSVTVLGLPVLCNESLPFKRDREVRNRGVTAEPASQKSRL